MEGIVSKRLSAPYQSGRSDSWTKAKLRAGQEVVIGGWKTTNGRFRSLMAGVQHDGHLAYVGIVGTGFGQDKVKTIMPSLKAKAFDKSPFGGKNAPRKRRFRVPFTPIQAATFLFGMLLVIFVGFVLFGRDPMGGEPTAKIAYDSDKLFGERPAARPPLLSERSDFLQGDSPAADKVPRAPATDQ